MKEIVLGHKAERDEFLSARYIQREGLQNARKNMKNNLNEAFLIFNTERFSHFESSRVTFQSSAVFLRLIK